MPYSPQIQWADYMEDDETLPDIPKEWLAVLVKKTVKKETNNIFSILSEE
jgi:hypothetical protein